MSLEYKTVYLKEISSTNSYALSNIADFEDKTVIIADKQTNGRGRLDRKWLSDGQDNVYMSIILKPSNRFEASIPFVNITQYMAVILSRILEKYNVDIKLKWPNDVGIINTTSDNEIHFKKIAGILSEVSTQGQKLNGFVLGLGVNLNFSQEKIDKIDQPATSLNLLTGKSINKDAFIEDLLSEFFNEYEVFIKKGFSCIKAEYEKKSFFLGRDIIVDNKKGIAEKVNSDGSLMIKTEDNNERIITIGDLICY
ncbi:MAG: biotin--[acetyl-CoA-carboxylase] ligase [Candidatus Gastranaerophilales bacterium]|nr:biotin--[acetyl-CoA-carboxylase] ligase [Candidatus Gastranaerophilales bacterium]